jgi:hypothetical protein
MRADDGDTWVACLFLEVRIPYLLLFSIRLDGGPAFYFLRRTIVQPLNLVPLHDLRDEAICRRRYPLSLPIMSFVDNYENCSK